MRGAIAIFQACSFPDLGIRPPPAVGHVRTTPDSCRIAATQHSAESAHIWTAPAVQEESDISAKRSGAAMYPACFRLEDCLRHDAAAVAAGPDVIR
jgi:hypothetical protein